MTPAIELARRASIDFEIHEYHHDASSSGYGEEAASKLGLDSHRVFKTLVTSLGTGTLASTLAVAIVPVSTQLNLKQMAKAAGAKKAVMAEARDVERATGYVLGGVSPLGQKKVLTTVIDDSANDFKTIFVSAGRRGLEIELAANDLARLTGGRFAAIAQSD